jgi:hypothetical protein
LNKNPLLNLQRNDYILFVVEFSKLWLVRSVTGVITLEDPCEDVVVVVEVKVVALTSVVVVVVAGVSVDGSVVVVVEVLVDNSNVVVVVEVLVDDSDVLSIDKKSVVSWQLQKTNVTNKTTKKNL